MNNIVDQIRLLIWERVPDEIVDILNGHLASMTVDQIREEITEIHNSVEESIESGALEAVGWETIHHFTNDAYCREFRIKSGSLVVGFIHHHEHFLFALKGDVIVMSEDGAEIVSAPSIFISKPGVKRVGYALTDIVWASVHVTNERDIDKLEQSLFSLNYEEYMNKE